MTGVQTCALPICTLSGPGDRLTTVRRVFLAGLALVALAVLWSQWLPFNKKLWSSSFAVLNIGIDSAVLAALTWLTDLRGVRLGTAPFATLGANPLALYILAEVLMALAWTFRVGDQSVFMAIFDTVFAGQVTGRTGSFAFGLALTLLCWAVGRALQRRSIFIRL